MLTELTLFCQVSALIIMSGGLVVRNTIMGIFQKIDLHQISGFFQEIKAIRIQKAHMKLFPILAVAITQTIDCLKCGVVNQARTRKVDDDIFRILFWVKQFLEAGDGRKKRGPFKWYVLVSP